MPLERYRQGVVYNYDLTSIRRPFDCLSHVTQGHSDVTHQWPPLTL